MQVFEKCDLPSSRPSVTDSRAYLLNLTSRALRGFKQFGVSVAPLVAPHNGALGVSPPNLPEQPQGRACIDMFGDCCLFLAATPFNWCYWTSIIVRYIAVHAQSGQSPQTVLLVQYHICILLQTQPFMAQRVKFSAPCRCQSQIHQLICGSSEMKLAGSSLMKQRGSTLTRSSSISAAPSSL